MTIPIFTAHSIEDLLATMPTLFGFQPEESVVAVATHGPRTRFGFRMRMDLPPTRRAADLASYVGQHIRNQHADGVILVVLSADHDAATVLLDALLDEFVDLEVVACVHADGSHYWIQGDPEPVPYEAPLHHPAVVMAIAEGQEIVASRSDLAKRVAGVDDAAVAAAVPAVVAQATAELRNARTREATAATGADAVLPIYERACARVEAGEPIDAADIAALAVWSSSIAVRDELWGRIDRTSAFTALAVWSDVARRAPESFAPAALGMAAFASWLTGDGIIAAMAAERALDIDPEYSFAHLMLDMLSSGMDPRAWPGWGDCSATLRG